jgi:tetratricopeptide (TPR) repeat protein
LEAYTSYLKGRYYWNKRTKEGYYKGIEHFAQAIAKDPAYAQAYTGLADCYHGLGWFCHLSPGEAYPQAKAAAKKALELDSTLAEAHASLAGPLHQYDYQWLEAEQEYKRAIELDPNYAAAHHWYALYLAMIPNRQREAVAHIIQAQELEPLSLIISAAVGRVFYLTGQFDQAIEQCQRTLEMDQNFWVAQFILGAAYAQKGEYEAAIAESQQAVITSKGTPQAVSTLGFCYAAAGRTTEALKIIDECKERSKHEYFPPYWIAAIYAGLGEKDQAFLWLNSAYAERSNWLVHLKVEPAFTSLRTDIRYDRLLGKVGLK